MTKPVDSVWTEGAAIHKVTKLPWPTLLYIVLASVAAVTLVGEGRWFAPVLVLPAIFGPWGIVVSGTVLRLAFIDTGGFSDPLIVVSAALDRVLSGQSPYGVGYPESVPSGAPFAYGPLMLIDSYPLELVASVGILVLLVWYAKPWTLALAAGLPFFLYLTSSGNNDMLPTLLLTGGLLTLPHWYGGALLGLSVAVKPYTAVFLPVAFANGSGTVLVIAVVTTGLGYLPALWWGGITESLAMTNALHGPSWLRFLAAPLALRALRWPLLSCAAFVALTMTSQVVSIGYLIPLVVGTGILLESADLVHPKLSS